MSSQSPYKVKIGEFAKFMFDKNNMSDMGIKQKFTLQGPNDLTIFYMLRARFDQETNQFKTSFEKIDITCK